MTSASNRPLNNSFPNLDSPDDAQLEALKENVAAQGDRNTIFVWRDRITDATHLAACLHMGILPQFVFLDDDEQPPKPGPQFEHLIFSLTDTQKAMAAAKLSLTSPQERPTRKDSASHANDRPSDSQDPAGTADAQIATLQAEVLAQGESSTIFVWRGRIIDATRLAVCLHMGILPQFEFLDDDEQPPEPGPQFEDLIFSLNQEQRALTAARFSINSRRGEKPQKATAGHVTIPQAAERFGVSERTTERARKLISSQYHDVVAKCLLPTSSPEHLTVGEATDKVARLDQIIDDRLGADTN